MLHVSTVKNMNGIIMQRVSVPDTRDKDKKFSLYSQSDAQMGMNVPQEARLMSEVKGKNKDNK